MRRQRKLVYTNICWYRYDNMNQILEDRMALEETSEGPHLSDSVAKTRAACAAVWSSEFRTARMGCFACPAKCAARQPPQKRPRKPSEYINEGGTRQNVIHVSTATSRARARPNRREYFTPSYSHMRTRRVCSGCGSVARSGLVGMQCGMSHA